MTKGELDLAGARLVVAQPGNANAAFALRKTLAMVANELGRGVGTIRKAREIVQKGASNVIAMVEAGEIGTSNAADGIRGKTKEEQAQMTAADLHKANRRFARGINNKEPKEPKPKPRVFEPYRPRNLSKIPGINPSSNPSLRVHLHPPLETGLLKDDLFLIDATARIRAAAEIDPSEVRDAIERMLAYEGKYRGKTDFAANAKTALDKLAGSLDAIERLAAALRDFVENGVREAVS
jgi:hypothetical protein